MRCAGKRSLIGGLPMLKLSSEWVRRSFGPTMVSFIGLLAISPIAELSAQNSSIESQMRFAEGLVLYEERNFLDAADRFEAAIVDVPAAADFSILSRDQAHDDSNIRRSSYLSESDGDTNIGGELSPGCDDAPSCDSYIESASPARRWNLTLITGHQYDSNVTLAPQFVGLGSGTGISDSSWMVAGFGEYRVFENERAKVGLIGSAYGNQYFHANQFDAHDFMGGGYTNFVVQPKILAGVRYEFHHTLLNYTSFANQHRLVPNLTFLQGQRGHLTTYYEFESQEFEFAPLIPAMNRSGDVNAIGFTQAIYTAGGEGRIYGGYRYENANTDGTDFDRNTNMVTARIEQPIFRRIIADAEFRYFWDDYVNPNSLDFNDRARDDERLEVRTGTQMVVSRHVSLRVDYTYINSNSNTANLFGVRFFNYDRHIVNSQFIYDF